MRRVLPVLRILAAILIVVALAGQLNTYMGYWHRIGIRDIALRVVDYWSTFTTEVNLAAAVLFVVGAVLLFRGAGAGPAWISVLRLCVLAAIILTSVVYNVLLRGQPVPAGSQLDWANNTFHVVAPILFLLDWLIAPRTHGVRFRFAWFVLVYPIVWLAYTLIRGPLVPDEIARTPYFYPYGFLNPDGPGGWGAVIMIVGLLIPFILLIGVASVALWRLEDRFRKTPLR